MPQQKKLADRLREAIRLRSHSIRTKKAYLHWHERFVRFHKLRHPAIRDAAKTIVRRRIGRPPEIDFGELAMARQKGDTL